VLDTALEAGINPLGGGLLGGALQKSGPGRHAGEQMQMQISQRRPQLEAYEQLSRELGETRPTSRWLGCSINRLSRPPSSVRAPRTS
jgi:hypothetical protein